MGTGNYQHNNNLAQKKVKQQPYGAVAMVGYDQIISGKGPLTQQPSGVTDTRRNNNSAWLQWSHVAAMIDYGRKIVNTTICTTHYCVVSEVLQERLRDRRIHGCNITVHSYKCIHYHIYTSP